MADSSQSSKSSSERSPKSRASRRLTVMAADPDVNAEDAQALKTITRELSKDGSSRRKSRDSALLLKSAPPSPLVHTSSRTSIGTPRRKQILFYDKDKPYYGFTNFSNHPVMYNGKKYPTSEHLFQSFKFQGHREDLAEHIRTCSSRPMVAFSEARRFQPEVRPDWGDVNVEKMKIALYHKFTQHQDLREELLATDDAELIEDSDKDSFWGIGADKQGRNELGKALEELRDKLRANMT